MGNAIVTFESPLLGVEIVIDRGQVLISLGSISDSRKDWLEFGDVVSYFAPSFGQVYDFDESIDSQLDKLSRILREYCLPLLKGELWMKGRIREIEKKRVDEMFGKFFEKSKQPRKGE